MPKNTESKRRRVLFTDGRTEIVIRRREAVDGGFRWVDDHWQQISYRVELDTDRLRQLAQRAGRNRKGVAVQGPLRVVVQGRQRLGDTSDGSDQH